MKCMAPTVGNLADGWPQLLTHWILLPWDHTSYGMLPASDWAQWKY